jgi:hypothetical protein
MARLLVLFVAFALASCAASADRTACLLREQKPMALAQLFFGRDIAGRAPLSDAEWSDFAAATLSANFPDGFTVTDGVGQWLNPETRHIVHEQSKIVEIAADDTPALGAKLAAVMAAYRTRFHQQSVGVITSRVCAAF